MPHAKYRNVPGIEDALLGLVVGPDTSGGYLICTETVLKVVDGDAFVDAKFAPLGPGALQWCLENGQHDQAGQLRASLDDLRTHLMVGRV